ncbi:MAG: carbohydrate ABC transporter permease [Defluviitaleaceae bacterium]|nr:carbohydrate ABC transporter permease [Defluviitaleaceae bacterium]
MLFLLIFGSVMAMPLILTISNALKPPNELWVWPPTFFARNPTFVNFRNMASMMAESIVPFSRYFFNTVFAVVTSTFFHIIFASMCAYPLALYKFPMSKPFANLVITAMMLAASVLTIPNYLIITKLGLLDTQWAIILPALASPLGLFLMKQFMETNVPMALLESAEIDGASEWGKYSRIVMPLSKPAWLTLMILTINAVWSTPTTIYFLSEQQKPLVLALQQVFTMSVTQNKGSGGYARWGVGAANAVFMLVVPLIVFILNQSNVTETMATSGIKD